MSDTERTTSDAAKVRVAAARSRAMSQVGHFAASSSSSPPDAVKCDRCGKPLNRWEERCDYQLTSAHLLAEDVLWLLDQLEASRAA